MENEWSEAGFGILDIRSLSLHIYFTPFSQWLIQFLLSPILENVEKSWKFFFTLLSIRNVFIL